jgi:hypothetical protein
MGQQVFEHCTVILWYADLGIIIEDGLKSVPQVSLRNDLGISRSWRPACRQLLIEIPNQAITHSGWQFDAEFSGILSSR